MGGIPVTAIIPLLTMIPAEPVLRAIIGAGNAWGGRTRQQRRSGAEEAKREARSASKEMASDEVWGAMGEGARGSRGPRAEGVKAKAQETEKTKDKIFF